MDENKLEKLKEIEYNITKTCGICAYSSFRSAGGDWGLCEKHIYEHMKHSKAVRYLSIYRGGICNGFRLNPKSMEQLGKYKEFLK